MKTEIYWIKTAGTEPHLVIPYTLDANDMRFVNAQGFGGGDQFFSYLKDSFDVLYAEGETLQHERVWVPTRLQIAQHWHANLTHLAENAFEIG